jgi:hypothetical protein
MKKNKFMLGMLTLLLTFSITLMSCGATDPKDLAKQSYEISQQALAAMFNPKKAAELEKKAASIEKKIAKLSESDRAIYTEELTRLADKGLGGLFEAASGAMDAVNKAAGALDSAQGLLDTASKLSDDPSLQDVQTALDTAQKAADLLNSFGN